MEPEVHIGSVMQEATKLAEDGELGNSNAIRLLEIPHSPEDLLQVLSRFDRELTPQAKGKLALEACFENGVEVMILDRPNPLGGLKVDGPPMEKSWQSYVGAFQIPYVHGMTIGELARMAVSKAGILDLTDAQRTNGKLTVVTMDGWRRYMSWPKLGLKWIAPSPNIPDFPAAVGYAMTGLGAQLGSFQHGIGSEYPFRVLTHKTASLDELGIERDEAFDALARARDIRYRYTLPLYTSDPPDE